MSSSLLVFNCLLTTINMKVKHNLRGYLIWLVVSFMKKKIALSIVPL